MATTATCVLPSVRCSASNHPVSFKVSDLNTAISNAVKLTKRKQEKSNLATEANKAIQRASLAILNSLVDSIFQFTDQPMHPSQKNFAPVEEIGELVKVDDCQGEVPKDFPEGIYIRNGPNPLFGGLKNAESIFGKTDSLWVEGEGMLHALHFTKDSEGNWRFYYKNRHVETETYKIESVMKKPAFLPVAEGDAKALFAGLILNKLRFGQDNKILSNTSVFEHGGKHYSVAENFLPQEIDLISLETYDNWNPSGSWSRAFTSHPKKAPGTGELVTVGFEPIKPYCVVGVISADGKELIHKLDLQLDHCSVFHEVGVTQKYNILIDSMLTLSTERVLKGGQLFKYEKEKDAKIAVIPRYGDADSAKWFRIEPCVTYHLMNTFEDGNEVVVRGCRANEPILPGPDWGEDKFDWFSRGLTFNSVNSNNESAPGSKEEGMLFATVREWRLNLETLEVKERDVTQTEYSMDFPMINTDFIGLKNQYGYAQVLDSLASSNAGKTKFGGLAKLYFEEEEAEEAGEQSRNGEGNVKIEYHWLPKNNFCTGSAFVSKPGSVKEDDGWIVTFVHDEDNDTSYVLVVDANKKRFADEPVAKISLPQRVPYGHHGSFFTSTT
uniref:carotenoid 9,10(9',10')-cleavage dioxygenase 1-like n=1 Tax=Erigeron canadensis TaxID=72917 RepID=UPI001CB9A326|nr:carotenoid 9,10(9',10')-cleavage dioxygenase 1-like [Erigeron canadensis]